jgi:hypothetical protein
VEAIDALISQKNYLLIDEKEDRVHERHQIQGRTTREK